MPSQETAHRTTISRTKCGHLPRRGARVLIALAVSTQPRRPVLLGMSSVYPTTASEVAVNPVIPGSSAE